MMNIYDEQFAQQFHSKIQTFILKIPEFNLNIEFIIYKKIKSRKFPVLFASKTFEALFVAQNYAVAKLK